MELYSFLRELADSWVLVAMFAFFVGAILWLWRPGSGALHAEAATLPFRHEDAPADTSKPAATSAAKAAPNSPETPR